ncbi:major capsid protein [Octadecabacter Antarctic BD virus 1]|nr:major capsid protein [Octadecabacter Antarctic BD virus 1]
MATVGNTYLTLADLRRQQNKDDTIADIIEILAEELAMLEDGPTFECNSGDEHLTTIRAGLPAPTWRKLYQGVQPTKGENAQVKDSTGYLEDWSEVDAKLVEKSKNPQKFRMNEGKSHIMGIAQEIGATAIYGDTDTDPEKFLGLEPRYNSLTAANGNQIVDAGGSGSDNTSVWFIGWGEMGTHFLYPEGSEAGIKREDKGVQTKEKADGSLYDVYREKFCQDIGLSVRDWRVNARVANIDVSDLNKGATGDSADLVDLMITAYYRLDNPTRTNVNTVIYCSRIIAEYLHKQAMNKTNVNLTLESIEGKPITKFLGHTVRRMDAILETEARVT